MEVELSFSATTWRSRSEDIQSSADARGSRAPFLGVACSYLVGEVLLALPGEKVATCSGLPRLTHQRTDCLDQLIDRYVTIAVGIAVPAVCRSPQRHAYTEYNFVHRNTEADGAIGNTVGSTESDLSVGVGHTNMHGFRAAGWIACGTIRQDVVSGGDVGEGKIAHFSVCGSTKRAESYDAILQTPAAPREVNYAAINRKRRHDRWRGFGRSGAGRWRGQAQRADTDADIATVKKGTAYLLDTDVGIRTLIVVLTPSVVCQRSSRRRGNGGRRPICLRITESIGAQHESDKAKGTRPLNRHSVALTPKTPAIRRARSRVVQRLG